MHNQVMTLINFRGQDALVIDLRIRKPERIEGLHYYEMRHSDEDFGDPVTIEYGVMVNHYGTIITKEPLIMTHQDLNKTEPNYIELTDEESETIGCCYGDSYTIQQFIDRK